MAHAFSKYGPWCAVVLIAGCSEAPSPDPPSEAARRLARFHASSDQKVSAPVPTRERLREELQPSHRTPAVAIPPKKQFDLKTWAATATLEPSEPAPTHVHSNRITLCPGRDLDFTEMFSFDRFAVERSLGEQNRVRNPHWKNVELTYPSGKPFLVFGRRGAQFHGVAIAYYENGNPMTYVNYTSGDRHGDFMTWDEERQPVYFAEYRQGEKHGMSCYYQKCASDCNDSHLLLVQEWERGEPWESHLVSGEEVALTLTHAGDAAQEPIPELTAAIEVVNDFEAGINDTEEQVKGWLLDVQRRIAQQIKLQRRRRIVQASQQRRSRGLALAASFGGGGGGGGGMRFGGS